MTPSMTKKVGNYKIFKLTSLFYLSETECPVVAGSGSLVLVGSPLAEQQVFLFLCSAPSLPLLHLLFPATLLTQDCGSFNNNARQCFSVSLSPKWIRLFQTWNYAYLQTQM